MKGGDIPQKTTGTTGTGTIRLLIFHLKSRISMRYDILTARHQQRLSLLKSQIVVFSFSKRPQKTCKNCLF